MLRFRLGDIPVEVRFSHLLFSALLSTLMVRDMPVLEPGVWPYVQLQDMSDPAYGRTALLVALGWMGLISSAVLVHELGHALMLRAFGYRPSVRLLWLGGHTQPMAPATLRWYQHALFTAGGPLAGFVLALVALGLWRFGVAPDAHAARFLLGWCFVINLFWTLFNLIPVPTLDGGTLLTTLATRFFGKAGFIGAQGAALVLCVALVAYGAQRAPVLGLLFGLYGLQALRLFLAAARGQLQVQPGIVPSPLAEELRQARRALEDGRLDEARERGKNLLEAKDATQELAARTHHLLGWVALKEGQGRTALDHFSQARRQPVETHALAAAFSLLGDEPRALALWELAWRETKHPTVLHEYAGSLIRAERVHNALKLPGVQPEAAFLCAGRTLFTRGAYSEAAAISEAGLAHAPAARLAYDAACAHARARHPHDAVRMLRRATELGFQDAPYAASDEDLATLHGHPEFETWLEALRKSPEP
ncbi:TPR end-of-group domain-containing protein [Melittangium boletus]|uniref:Peptidase M50 n=1 Tax=Melittangium boletus DSM 14713 TaxID=1294270 RepID=A0A250I9S1_9BACT|nr:site-2 protease family protein [Melittangium boletus]ATB28495.1 peptidase M50 [Melittangium boletus DSM 14713]